MPGSPIHSGGTETMPSPRVAQNHFCGNGSRLRSASKLRSSAMAASTKSSCAPRGPRRRRRPSRRMRFKCANHISTRRVGEVLREMEDEAIELPYAIAAVRLLILTGMTLRWEYVDIPSKALRLPDSKTGAKIIHLGQPAIEVLERIERIEKNPWVIVGITFHRPPLCRRVVMGANSHAATAKFCSAILCCRSKRRACWPT
jgi:hypothetical protein